ncbi:MAG: sensor domain-containing diguanylate cyclase [Pseudomonadota bacterium]
MSLDTATISLPTKTLEPAGVGHDTAFDSVTDFVLEVTGSAMAHLSLAQPVSGRSGFTSVRFPHLPPDRTAQAMIDSVCAEVYRTAQPIWIADWAADSRAPGQALRGQHWFASCLAIPVRGCGPCPAAVLLAIDSKPRCWAPRDADKLSRLGDFVSTQIHLRAALELREVQHRTLLDEVEARRKAERELQRQACTDALTGLANRRAFERAAADVLDKLKGRDRAVSVVMIDLDQFKAINDRHGHSAGDLVLRSAAGLIHEELDARVDLLARLGGEEFAAVLPGLGPCEARARSERCRHRLESAGILLDTGEPIRITASFGISPVLAEDATVRAALARADRALYTAKAKGRNRVVAW